MPSFLDFFRSKKRSGRRVHDDQRSVPVPQAPSSGEHATQAAASRVSKKLSVKEEPTQMALDVTQMGGTTAPPVAPAPRPRKEKRRREEDKFHRPIVQRAEDVRNKQKVDLHIEELHWHSGGVFSNVYRGKLVSPEKMEVAIKKTWPKDSVRSDEMIILAAMRRASPKNIIKLLYIFKNQASDGTECEAFIFAYMPETLDKAIRRGVTTLDMKIYIWQLFNGLDFLAANRIAHRDIKPINILVNKETGELQIGDFGSAKVISSRERSSAYQVTRYYRPPEMLLGSNHYSHMIDVWSAGCVLGEMIKGRVMFRGSDSEHQMQLIQTAFGTPTDDQLKAMKVNMKNGTVKLKHVAKAGLLVSLRLQTEGGAPPVLPATTAQAISLLRKVLVYNPESRLCGKEFLEDAFFDDVLSGNCVRDGRKIELARQSDDTMCHQCFERSQKSARDNRVSKMAEPPEKDEQVSGKQVDKTDPQIPQAETEEPSNDKDSGPSKTMSMLKSIFKPFRNK
ncbi:hypothetical protein PRIPAC_84077 [Pristionchus pacificus]|uniref:Protein kinase domain-containing protein n=1 Tax=Pristionchus pacificus TaxID=54126 RepID=A0A2A6CCX7_PRIPA|nr:hypothetical protein PRIPAC_84077 [Pristionchus pacificus]|eukprot:PDM75861.1 protein kinase [Pristionchus pacificus]